MKNLENKIAIITGAGSGIGKSIALAFAAASAKVVVCDVSLEKAQQVSELIKAAGKESIPVEADVSNENQIKDLIQATIEKYGVIDVLINNAGIMDDFLPVTEVQPDRWRRVLEVNLYSMYYACHYALPEMLKAGKGVIVNVRSVGGLGGGKAGAAYTSSKHGVIGLTKNIAYMYAASGIRCNAIAPGGVETAISENMKPSKFGYERMTLGTASVPRTGKPDEVANLALFLASDDSSLVNGTVITADGGWTAY